MPDRLLNLAGRAGVWCLLFAAGVAAFWLVLLAGVVNVTSTVEPRQMRPEIGSAHIAPARIARTPYAFADDRSATAGVVGLSENGARLGPGAALHADIRTRGGGRFSVWGGWLYFSAGDNSNPAANGRVYALRGPVQPGTPWVLLAAGVAGLGALLVLAARRLGGAPRKTRLLGPDIAPLLAGALAAAAPIIGRASLDPPPSASRRAAAALRPRGGAGAGRAPGRARR